MTEPFSHEDRMQAGESVISLFDALEDPDLQAHMIEARREIEAAVDNLKGQGLTTRQAALALVGFVLGPVLAE